MKFSKGYSILFSLCLSFFLLLSCSDQPGSGSDGNLGDGIQVTAAVNPSLIVHFKKVSPAAWTSVNCYYWASNGSPVSNSWPGSAMTVETGSWMVFTVPGGATSSNVIFDNGSAQTVDLNRSGEGWFVPAGTSGGKITGTWYDANPDGGGTAPAAPTNITATTVSSSSITVSWTASATATSYTVYQSTSSGGTYASVGTPTGTSLTVTGLTASTAYYYKVTAANSYGTSAYSSIATATTSPPSGSGLKVHFKVNSFANWTSVKCYYWASNGTPVANAWPGTAMTSEGSSWWVFTVPGASTYSNVIFNNGSVQTVDLNRTAEGWFVPTGTSGGKITGTWYNSNPDPTGPPAAPSNVIASPASSSSILITWSAPVGASSYTVYQASSSTGPFTSIGTPTAASFTATGLTASTTYFYKVTATNAYGTSPDSSIVSATTSSVGTPPSPPTNVTAAAVSSSSITVSWTASSGATSYTVSQSTSSTGTFNSVGSPTGTSFTVNSLAASTVYYYKVTASNAYGTSAYSNVASATTLPGGGGTQADPYIGPVLTWDSNAKPENGIVVNFITSTSSIGAVEFGTTSSLGSIKNETSATTSHHIEVLSLNPTTTYYYRATWDNGATHSKTYSFKTLSATQTAVTFIVMGDMQDNGTDRRWQAIADEVRINHADADFILGDGDLPWDDAANWWLLFFNKGRDLLASKAFMSSVGNHDGSGSYGSFSNWFKYPTTTLYYSFKVGFAGFITLNSFNGDFGVGGTQYNYTQTNIANMKADPNNVWLFVNYHVPPYDVGTRHGGEGNRTITQLYDGKVDWCFGGHEHTYQRTKPLRYNASVQSTYGNAAGQGVGYITQPPSGNWPETGLNSSNFMAYPTTSGTVPSEIGFVKVILNGRTASISTYGMGDLVTPKPSHIVDSVSYTK